MNYLNTFKIALTAIRRNKLRAFLTMLGIIIGVASVIAMLAMGEGSKSYIKNQMSGLGTNLVMIMPGAEAHGPVRSSGTSKLEMSDLEAIARNQYVAAISPLVQSSAQVVYGNNNWSTSIYGVTQEYLPIKNLVIGSGRVFTVKELHALEKVCIIGQKVATELFPQGEDPLGKTIRVKNTPFKVIGILQDKGTASMGQDQNDVIIAPYTTVQRRLLSIDYIQGINLSVTDDKDSEAAVAEIKQILRREHKIKEGDDDDFNIMSQSEMISTVSTVIDAIKYLLGAIAGISLLVGGIGIMNIMLVSVTERTREIGLRMSVGGRGNDILLQFLIEAAVLSVLGGIIGIIIGYLLATFAGNMLGVEALVRPYSVVLSFSVCVGIGLFFGWYPARKAANLNPIDAIRYE
jgi:putative ABC transport system permease protein